jgi:8-oxo-dGTP pyrophosphatase MutT (NUDIX family)
LWGAPKGSLEYKENHFTCAIREVKEETGLDISNMNINKYTKIQNKAVYYYVNIKEIDVSVQDSLNKDEQNDANGITWIDIKCLNELISNGSMCVSQHCRILFRKFLNIELITNEFRRYM